MATETLKKVNHLKQEIKEITDLREQIKHNLELVALLEIDFDSKLKVELKTATSDNKIF